MTKTHEPQAAYRTDKYRDPMDDILDRPISYNPAFRRITGSTVAAIFATQCWYWSKRHRDDDGWFWKTGAEWEEETGLTRSEQETARKHCKRAGIVEEQLKGVPATMYYRINRSKIYELLGVQFAEIQQSSAQADGQFEGSQQSDVGSNFNKEPKTPPIIPPQSLSEPLSQEEKLLTFHRLDLFVSKFDKFIGEVEIGKWLQFVAINGEGKSLEIMDWAVKKEIHMTNRAALMDSLETAAANWSGHKPRGRKINKVAIIQKSLMEALDGNS